LSLYGASNMPFRMRPVVENIALKVVSESR